MYEKLSLPHARHCLGCFRFDVSDEKLEPTLFRKAKLKGKIDLDNFETKQVNWQPPLFADGKESCCLPPLAKQ